MTQPEALRIADMLEAGNNGHPSRAAAELRRLYILALERQGQLYQLEWARTQEKKTAEQAAAELRRLHAENESLKADAERYRYLRNRYPSDVLDKTGLEAGAWIDCEDINGTLVLLTGEHADETIDAERSKT